MDRSIRCQSVERCRHLGMKTTGELVVAFLLAFTSACYSQTGYIPDQPSFDCSKASNAVAHILCSVPANPSKQRGGYWRELRLLVVV